MITRTSDWWSVDPWDVLLVSGLMRSQAGGVWETKLDYRVHRTAVKLLPKDIQCRLAPLYGENIPEVTTPDLRPYQKIAANFARSREGSLLALSMGVGKTRTSLFASKIDPAKGHLVIVAPKVTFGVWSREIKLVYGPDVSPVLVRGRSLAEDIDELRRPGIYLLNPEILSARWSEWLGGPRLDAVILDEAHLYAHGQSKRTAAAMAIANLADQRIALTGTPILRHPMDLHGVLGTVAPGAFGSWKAMADWLGVRRTKFGFDLSENLPSESVKRLESRLPEIMLRQRWEEVSDEVPELSRETIRVSLPSADMLRYTELATDVRRALGDRVRLSTLQSASALVQLGQLRRLVGRAKVSHAIELLSTIGEPAVLWTWHRDVAKQIAHKAESKLGLRVVCVTGDTPEKERQEAIRRFQVGAVDVFVGTLAIGSVGIDLTRARISVFVELSYTPADHAQAEARTWRSGQKRACMTYWMVADETIEDRVIEILIRKSIAARESVCAALTEEPGDSVEWGIEELIENATRTVKEQ